MPSHGSSLSFVKEKEMTCRRLAIQLAAQLPEDREEARLALQYAAELLGWLMGPETGEGYREAEGAVLTFPGAAMGSPTAFNR